MHTCPRCGHKQDNQLSACELCGAAIPGISAPDAKAAPGKHEAQAAPRAAKPADDHWAYEDPELLEPVEAEDDSLPTSDEDSPEPDKTEDDQPDPIDPQFLDTKAEGAPEAPFRAKPRYMHSPTLARPNPRRYEPFVIKNAQGEVAPRGTWTVNFIMWTLSFLLVGAIVLFALYKGSVWGYSLWINHFYEIRPGEAAPTVEEILLEDGRGAHRLTFFGKDGELILLSQLKRSYLIVGGKADIVIPHNEWFDMQPPDIESLEVTITPVRQALSGAQSLLPPIKFTVTAPLSPIQLIQPATLHQQVFKSIYTIQVKVLPGSQVYVGGKDVTDLISATGALSVNQPVGMGENTVSILVRSENQRENRIDLVLERPLMDIETYLDYSVGDRSTTGLFVVSGKTQPGASIAVSTPHNANSIKIDGQGHFSFTSKFDRVGNNQVEFDVSMPGKKNAHIEFQVMYMPTVDEYTKKAWRMDYEKLKTLFDEWIGVIFLCEGTVVDTVSLDPQRFVMNVGTADAPKLVLLENQSNMAAAETGKRYKAFADVTGMEAYKDGYIPTLTTRYMMNAK